MRKIISLALAMLLVFSIAGCSQKGVSPDSPQGSETDVISSLPAVLTNVKEDDLCGEWQMEIDMVPYIQRCLDNEFPPDSLFPAYRTWDFPDIPQLDLSIMIPVYLCFEEGGTYYCNIDADAFVAAIPTCIGELVKQASEVYYLFWEEHGYSRPESDERMKDKGFSNVEDYFMSEFTDYILQKTHITSPYGTYEIRLEDNSIIFRNANRCYYTGDAIIVGSDLQTVSFVLRPGRLILKPGNAFEDLIFTKGSAGMSESTQETDDIIAPSLPAVSDNIKENDLHGVWKTEIDFDYYFRNMAKWSWGEPLDSVDISWPDIPKLDKPVMVPIYLRLEEDSTHVVGIDEDEYKAATKTCVELYVKSVSADVYRLIEESGVSRQSLNTMLAERGFASLEECLATYYTNVALHMGLAEYVMPSGTYEIRPDNNRIIFKNSNYFIYTGDETLCGFDFQTMPFSFNSGCLTLEVGGITGELTFTKIPVEEMPNHMIYSKPYWE